MGGISSATKIISKGKFLGKLDKGMFKKTISFPQETQAKRVLGQADGLLKNQGLKLQGEIPADQFMRNIPEAQRKAVTDLLGNPETVQFAAKHNKNGRFSILGLIAKKGDKTVGKGALSITNFGQPNAVAKWRISTGAKGRNLQANGFIDCAQTATPQEVSIVPSFIKKMLGLDTKLGKAASSHIQVNPTKAAKLIREGKLDNIAHIEGISQAKIDKVLDTARKNIGNLY